MPITAQQVNIACNPEISPEEWKRFIKAGVLEESRKITEMPRFIYFIRSGSGHIKIGSANNVKARMYMMQTGCPFKLKLLGKVKVGEFTENKLHRMFKQYKFRGEWFMESPEILEFVASNKMGRRCKCQEIG